MLSVRLRAYRSSDVSAMVVLDSVCFTREFRFDAAGMREFSETPGAVVLLAEEAKSARLAGFVIVHLEGRLAAPYGYVVTIDVAPDFRNMGLGTEMLRAAEQQVLATGADRMGLHVAANNAAAIRFYEGLGYVRSGVAPQFYREAGLDALVYRKELRPK